jgi:hypothetical protein
VEEAEDVVEARPQLHAQHPAFGTMLVILSIWKHVQLEYREPFARHP